MGYIILLSPMADKKGRKEHSTPGYLPSIAPMFSSPARAGTGLRVRCWMSPNPTALMSSARCRLLGFLREQQRTLSQSVLQDLLVWLVQDLGQEIPGRGETVAFDVTHIYAWVRENNPRVYVQGAFNVTHI